jgi:hypothetical protein
VNRGAIILAGLGLAALPGCLSNPNERIFDARSGPAELRSVQSRTLAAPDPERVLRWMGKTFAHQEEMMVKAAAHDNEVEVLRWLHARARASAASFRSWVISGALHKDSIEVLEWLRETDDCANVMERKELWEMLKRAADRGHVRSLNWLLERGGVDAEICRTNSCELLRRVASWGNMGVLEWLRERGAATPEDCRANNCEILINAAGTGNMEVLEWLRERGAATPEDCRARDNKALRTAILRSSVEVLRWLHERGTLQPGDAEDTGVCNCINDVVRRGYVETLEWVYEHGLITGPSRGGLFQAAIRHDQLSCLKYMRKCGLLSAASWPRGASAEQYYAFDNHPVVLEWLIDQGLITKEDCQERAKYVSSICVLRLLARRMDLSDFDGNKLGQLVWWQQQQQSMLALILAGWKSKPRLPPELWELVHEALF